MKTDIEIAQESTPLKITEVAKSCGIDEKYIEQYGNYKAKIDYRMLKDLKDRPDGKLILVTAITPTPAGEGKTTTSVGPGGRPAEDRQDTPWRPCGSPLWALCSASRAAPPAAGYAQVVPMEDINLHFTGDFHANRRGQQPAGPPCWTTTSSRATPWASTSSASPGSGAWT